MALPQFKVFGPGDEFVGVYESRPEADHAIEAEAAKYAAGFRVDDSEWRAAEQAERDAEYQAVAVAEAEAVLADEQARVQRVHEAMATVAEAKGEEA